MYGAKAGEVGQFEEIYIPLLEGTPSESRQIVVTFFVSVWTANTEAAGVQIARPFSKHPNDLIIQLNNLWLNPDIAVHPASVK